MFAALGAGGVRHRQLYASRGGPHQALSEPLPCFLTLLQLRLELCVLGAAQCLRLLHARLATVAVAPTAHKGDSSVVALKAPSFFFLEEPQPLQSPAEPMCGGSPAARSVPAGGACVFTSLGLPGNACPSCRG